MNNTVVLPNDLKNEILIFARQYDELKPGSLDTISKWLSNDETENLRHFLKTTSIEKTISFSCEDLDNMTLDELAAVKYRAKQLCAVLKRKEELFLKVSNLK